MMKPLVLFAALLLSTAIVSANYTQTCGAKSCSFGEMCYTMDNAKGCRGWQSCTDVTLDMKNVGSWQDGSRNNSFYTQYEITIKNSMKRNIKEIVLGTDGAVNLRDSSSLWGITQHGGDFTLPAKQSINGDSSYTFGFIVIGTSCPKFFIKAVVY